MVLGILIALIALVAWGGSTLIGGKDPVATPTATPSPTPSPTAAPTVTAGGVAVRLQSSATPCDPESIRITPAVESGQFNGGPVKIQLAINTDADKPCTFEPADADLLVIISHGDTTVYDSTVCPDPFITQNVALAVRWAAVVVVEWSGRASGPKCSPTMAYASPRSYILKIGTLGGEPGKTRFTLTPKPKPTPSPSPSAQPDEPTVTPR